MSTSAEVRLARRILRHELEAIRGNWGWLLGLGIALIVVGTFAIGAPLIASLATAVVIGVLLLMGGIAQLVGCVLDARDWSGFFLSLLAGILTWSWVSCFCGRRQSYLPSRCSWPAYSWSADCSGSSGR